MTIDNDTEEIFDDCDESTPIGRYQQVSLGSRLPNNSQGLVNVFQRPPSSSGRVSNASSNLNLLQVENRKTEFMKPGMMSKPSNFSHRHDTNMSN